MDGFEVIGMPFAVVLLVLLARYSTAGLALLERKGEALTNPEHCHSASVAVWRVNLRLPRAKNANGTA
jgi:hypothetical protein